MLGTQFWVLCWVVSLKEVTFISSGCIVYYVDFFITHRKNGKIEKSKYELIILQSIDFVIISPFTNKEIRNWRSLSFI